MHIFTEEEFSQQVKELRGKQFPVLSEGYVMLVDAMGGDKRIVDAARTTSDVEGKSDADDVNLLRYLMRHRHSTPTEFAQLTLKIRIPMDAWRQGVRHRMASINEFSSRYSEVPDRNDKTPPDKWRLQSVSNRQGSSGEHVTDYPESVYLVNESRPGESAGAYLSRTEDTLHMQARAVYEERLRFGVAKEQARKDLCLSTYTELYWHWDMHNLMHMLGLRMDKHAQLEIRMYANIIGEQIVAKLFPVTWQAFLDYRLNALTLTALDQRVIGWLLASQREHGVAYSLAQFAAAAEFVPAWHGLQRCRERDECLAKLQRLTMVEVT